MILNKITNVQIEENVNVNTEQSIITEGATYIMDTNHCMASAISAGLGAMTFRNHLRSLTEISDRAKAGLKTAGKVGVGALAAGGAAYGAYKNQESIKGFAKGLKKKWTDRQEANDDIGSRTAPHASTSANSTMTAAELARKR